MVDELKQVVDNEDLLIDFSVDNDLKGFTLEKTVKM